MAEKDGSRIAPHPIINVNERPGVHDNVPHPTAMKRYNDNTQQKVYRTDQDSSIEWTLEGC